MSKFCPRCRKWMAKRYRNKGKNKFFIQLTRNQIDYLNNLIYAHGGDADVEKEVRKKVNHAAIYGSTEYKKNAWKNWAKWVKGENG